MFPIPTPDRLIDLRLHRAKRATGSAQPSLLALAGEGLFYIGFMGLLAAAAIICGALAAELSAWLALPAGALGLWAMLVICRRAKALAGVLEAVLYGGLVASLHTEGQDPLQYSPAWIAGAVVALVFLLAAYATLKPRAR